MVKKKITKKSSEEYRAWAILIPKIEGILKSDISSEHKCVLIEYEIQKERKR